MTKALSSYEREILYEALELACKLVNSVQNDIEEDPNAASNETCIIANELRDKINVLNESVNDEGALQ